MTRARVLALTAAVLRLAVHAQPLVIIGNERFFSLGADLAEIATLIGPSAHEFAAMGQRLMKAPGERGRA
ncbi:MAG TPA: hypothetical protein VN622_17435 [Clostridia bacterium]|nr:hypothetical protein [Clostridia bacterium]